MTIVILLVLALVLDLAAICIISRELHKRKATRDLRDSIVIHGARYTAPDVVVTVEDCTPGTAPLFDDLSLQIVIL